MIFNLISRIRNVQAMFLSFICFQWCYWVVKTLWTNKFHEPFNLSFRQFNAFVKKFHIFLFLSLLYGFSAKDHILSSTGPCSVRSTLSSLRFFIYTLDKTRVLIKIFVVRGTFHPFMSLFTDKTWQKVKRCIYKPCFYKNRKYLFTCSVSF